MENILLHGLGQNSNDWNTVKNALEEKGLPSVVPDLFELAKGRELNYSNVYQALDKLCDSYGQPLNLCGLSLGGLLALQYAIAHPEKINSLVLMGTPFVIPRKLLKFQSFLFQLMPKSAFQNIGCSKKDFINLSKSMTDLNFMQSSAQLDCPALILCGAKDKANMESARLFHEAMKNSRRIILEDCGHEVNKDHPYRVASILQGFWNEC